MKKDLLLQFEKQIQATTERLQKIKEVVNHISEHNSEIVKQNASITAINKYMAKLNAEIAELSTRKDNLEEENTKLKELTVNPKTCLSMQRHDQRSEFWFVAEGQATVYTLNERSTDQEIKCELTVHQNTFIKTNEWHQLCNDTDRPLKLIEIQYGENCVEEDIVRK